MDTIKDKDQIIREKINRLPAAKKQRLLNYIQSKSNIYKQEIDNRKKYFPLKNIIPNVAQERALLCYKSPNDLKYTYPKYNVFTGGNGVGKTLSLVILLAGCALGTDFLNKDYFDYDFFRLMENKRKKKPLTVWLICKIHDMSVTGSLYTTIKQYIPTAKITGKVDGKYYTEIEIPSPKPGYHKTVISVKTFNLDLVSFSGSNIDLELFNEPLKDQKKFEECVGRTRQNGYVALFLTPLDGSAYIQKLVDDIKLKSLGMVRHTKGSLWENCKDRPGTNGVLSEDDILAQIAVWKKNPITLNSRVNGDFVHLAGAIFPLFNNDVHVISMKDIHNFISKEDYVVQAVDHHGAKPDVGVWMKINPLNVWHVIAEYPNTPWDEIVADEKSIKHYGYDFKMIETGKVQPFNYMKELVNVEERLGDPNAFSCKQSYGIVKKTLQDQYNEDCGLFYSVEVDNSIELRHDEISNLLYYDILKKLSSSNSPKLFIYETCPNVINAFHYYIRNENDKIVEEWKDWIDCIGYIVTTITSYKRPNNAKAYNGVDQEYINLYGNSKKNKIDNQAWSNGYLPVNDKHEQNKHYGMYSSFGIES